MNTVYGDPGTYGWIALVARHRRLRRAGVRRLLGLQRHRPRHVAPAGRRAAPELRAAIPQPRHARVLAAMAHVARLVVRRVRRASRSAAPAGGRCGRSFNVLLIFTLIGLWHGAGVDVRVLGLLQRRARRDLAQPAGAEGPAPDEAAAAARCRGSCSPSPCSASASCSSGPHRSTTRSSPAGASSTFRDGHTGPPIGRARAAHARLVVLVLDLRRAAPADRARSRRLQRPAELGGVPTPAEAVDRGADLRRAARRAPASWSA